MMSSKNISEFKENIIRLRNDSIDQIINAFTDFYFGVDKARKDLDISIVDIQTLGNALSEIIVKQTAENFNTLLKSFTKDVADLEAVYIKRLSNSEYKINDLNSNIENLTQMISSLDLRNKSIGTQLSEASEKILDLSEQNKKLTSLQTSLPAAQVVPLSEPPLSQKQPDTKTSVVPQESKLEPQKLLVDNLLNKVSQYETTNAQLTSQVEKHLADLSDLRKTLTARDQEVEHYRNLTEEYKSKFDAEVIKNENLQNQHEEQMYKSIEPKTNLANIQNILISKAIDNQMDNKTEKNHLVEKDNLINELKDKLGVYETEINNLKEQISILSQKETIASNMPTGTEFSTDINNIKEFYRKELDSIPKYQILFRLEKTGLAKTEDLRKTIQYSRPAMETLLKDLIKEKWITLSGKDNDEVKLLKKLP